MVKAFKSKVSRAVPGSDSVRATIPEAVAAVIGAEPGSTLAWEIEPESRRAVVWVEKPKRSKDS